jgi:nitrite reductase/ring-hydroxylating ferredoxin subunit
VTTRWGMKRVKVARFEQIPPGGGVLVETGNVRLVLFKLDGRIFAIDDSCLRCGSSLATGTLTVTTVNCANCTWKYDVQTGCVKGVPALRIDTFIVKVVDSEVMVEVPSP